MFEVSDLSQWLILVVDDEPDNLLLVEELFKFKGIRVVSARGGHEALTIADQRHPSIVLLDLAMPEIDGWEVHRQLRARRDFDDVPIIALTALAMPDDVSRVRAAGFDGYITKPFRIMGLMTQLDEFVAAFLQKQRAGSQEPDLETGQTPSTEG